jgi:hypothetical protein
LLPTFARCSLNDLCGDEWIEALDGAETREEFSKIVASFKKHRMRTLIDAMVSVCAAPSCLMSVISFKACTICSWHLILHCCRSPRAYLPQRSGTTAEELAGVEEDLEKMERHGGGAAVNGGGGADGGAEDGDDDDYEEEITGNVRGGAPACLGR